MQRIKALPETLLHHTIITTRTVRLLNKTIRNHDRLHKSSTCFLVIKIFRCVHPKSTWSTLRQTTQGPKLIHSAKGITVYSYYTLMIYFLFVNSSKREELLEKLPQFERFILDSVHVKIQIL
jgi:hypothetical protein